MFMYINIRVVGSERSIVVVVEEVRKGEMCLVRRGKGLEEASRQMRMGLESELTRIFLDWRLQPWQPYIVVYLCTGRRSEDTIRCVSLHWAVVLQCVQERGRDDNFGPIEDRFA